MTKTFFNKLFQPVNLLVLAAIGLPFSAIPNVLENVSAVALCGMLIYLCWFRVRCQKSPFSRSGYELGFILFITASVFACLDAYLPSIALADVLNNLASILLFYVLAAFIQKKEHWEIVIAGLYFGFIILLLAGLYQVITINWGISLNWGVLNVLNDRAGPNRVCSLFMRRAGTNVFSAYLALVLPLFICWFIATWNKIKSPQKLLHSVVGLLLILNVLYTFSRSLLISLAVITFVAVMFSKYRKSLTVGVVVIFSGLVLLMPPLQKTFLSFFDSADWSNMDHLYSLQMAKEQILEHPFNGWGGGHINTMLKLVDGRWVNLKGKYVNQYNLPGVLYPENTYWKVHNQALAEGVIIVHNPHNIFFSMLLNYGVFGLIAFLTLIALVFKKLLNIAKHSASPEFRWFGLGGLYGLGAFMIYSLFLDSLNAPIMATHFWLFLVLVYKLEELAVDSQINVSKDLLILAYHRICPESHLRGTNTLAVTTQQFIKQIEFLKKQNYFFMTLKQYNQIYIDAHKKLDQKICLITFDDGYIDNYHYALPILQKYQIVATFFITTGSVGKQELFYWDYKNFAEYHPDDRCMNWEELTALKGAGMEIGSHTVNHYELTQLDQKQLKYELNHSKQILDKKLKQKTVSICYPRGSFNNSLLQEIAKAGYKVGVLTNAALFDNIEKTNYTLSRIGIYNQDQGLRFKLKLSKITFLIKKILGV